MPLPPTFIPIYTRQPQVDPIYRRYGLDELSSGISADAALDYSLKFSGGQALGRASQLREARGLTLTPMDQQQLDISRGGLAEEQRIARELTGEPEPPPLAASEAVAMRPVVAPVKLSPLLQPDDLNARFGVEGRLKFEKPEYEEAARLLNEWAIDDVTREETLRRADQGLGSQAVRLGAGLVGSMLDPLNLASAFIPVIPEAMFASWAARSGVTAARLGKGAAEGFVGTALLEPIVYSQSQAEQADYGMWDSLANVAFGTVLGGGLHAGGGAVADAVGRMRWGERAEILKGAVGQFVDRGEVRVDAAMPEAARMAWRDVARSADAAAEPRPAREPMTPEALQAATVRAETEARAVESTAAFKSWFGESKVVDEQGKPIVAYHGTTADFDAFQPGRNKAEGESGLFFVTDPSIASQYAGYDEIFPSDKIGTVMPVHLKAENPLVVDFKGGKYGRGEAIQRAIDGGHDSVLLKNHYDAGGVQDQWVVFKPEQIKSVFNEFPDAASPRLIDQASPEAQARIRAAAVRASLAPSSETVADLHSAAVMADTVAKAPKADTPEQSIAAIQKDMATLDEQLQSIGPEVPKRTTAEGGAQAAESTAAFKEWFGDSKIVDEAGKPLRIYHGTSRVSEDFHPSRGDHDLGPGIYLTRDVETANYYSDRWGAMSGSKGAKEGAAVIPVYASIKKPIYDNEPIPASVIQEAKKTKYDDSDTEWREVVEDAESNGIFISDIAMSDHEGRWFAAIKAAGYDGIIGKGPEAEVVAFRPEQVKSVFTETLGAAGAKEAAPKYAAWLDAEDIAYLAEADDMIAQAAARADVARVAALCGLGVG